MESKYTIMNISKHKACSTKYSQILENLSLRGGVKRKAYAPLQKLCHSLIRLCISQALFQPSNILSASQSWPCFIVQRRHKSPWNWFQLILSPPNLLIRSSQCSVIPSRRTLSRKIISRQSFWMLESIPCWALVKYCPLKCLTLIFS